MQRQRLGQDLADRHARIERGIGVLEDDLGVAAERAQPVGVEREQVAALEADTAGIRLDQPQHQPADGGFAATGLADQRQRLAGLDLEADAVDRLDEGGRPPEQRTLGDEASALLASFEKKKAEAEANAAAIVAEAKAQAEQLKKDAVEKMNDVIARRTKQAEAKIAFAESQAAAEVRAAAADHAAKAAEIVLRDQCRAREARTSSSARSRASRAG